MSTSSSVFVFFILIVFALFRSSSTLEDADSCKNERVIFCYYSSWSIYRQSYGSFRVENIDASLCTHILYSFAGLGIDGLTTSLDPWNDLPGVIGGNNQYQKFKELKGKNPCLTTLLSIGGWYEGSEKFSLMVETAETRTRFVDHLQNFLVHYGFDGVDIDWEYPAQRGSLPEDRDKFVLLLRELKEKLAKRGRLLTVALGASDTNIDLSYDVQAIGEIADYLLLMTFDYHRTDITSLIAPLTRVANDVNTGSVTDTVNLWLSKGAPAKKLVMGLTTTARTFILDSPNSDPSQNGLGSPIASLGPGGPYTNTTGFMAYYELCNLLAEGDWHVFRTDNYACNYATKGDLWVTYDNENTIYLKSLYARSIDIAGVMMWSLDTDDFRGYCHRNQYMLLTAARRGLAL